MSDILIVTQAAATKALVELESVKSELSISGTADDAFLQKLIEQASAAAETYCARTFAVQEYRQTFRLDRRSESLVLRGWPLISIDAVTEDGVALTENTHFETDMEAGIIRRIVSDRPADWAARAKIVVDFTAGYYLPGDTLDDLPPDVESAVTQMVKAAYLSRDRDPNVSREIVPQVYDVTFSTYPSAGGANPMPPHIAALLDPYRSQVYA